MCVYYAVWERPMFAAIELDMLNGICSIAPVSIHSYHTGTIYIHFCIILYGIDP